MTDRSPYHVAVLSREVCTLLCNNKNGIYVDATLGGGGHFGRLAGELESGATLIGIDRDPDAIAQNRANPIESRARIIIEKARFSQIAEILMRHSISALDGALLDLGVSSFQIDNIHRGFSFMQPCGLDMRMDPCEGATAQELIGRLSVEELSEILESYGEVRNAPRMAAAMKNSTLPLRTSDDLRECLGREYGNQPKYKVLAKVFMALRIAVNDELSELRLFLESLPQLLNEGARVAVISYHSLEDRMVKEFFRSHEPHCICPEAAPVCTCGKPGQLKRITRKPVIASPQEVERNPRARSARLRVAEKCSGGTLWKKNR